MTPTFEDGPAQLWLGDCLDILPMLGKVDAVITDPPYSENTHRMAKTNRGSGSGVKLVTFPSLTDDGFTDAVAAMLKISDGWVVLTCDYRHAALTYSMPEFVRLGAWVKPNPMPQISADRPGQGFETVAILHSGKRTKQWNRGGGAGVWTYSPESGGDVPTQKPVPLLVRLVKDFTNEAETVADLYMGSGTTGIACIRTGRKFIGVEKCPIHFKTAMERIKRELDQSLLAL